MYTLPNMGATPYSPPPPHTYIHILLHTRAVYLVSSGDRSSYSRYGSNTAGTARSFLALSRHALSLRLLENARSETCSGEPLLRQHHAARRGALLLGEVRGPRASAAATFR